MKGKTIAEMVIFLMVQIILIYDGIVCAEPISIFGKTRATLCDEDKMLCDEKKIPLFLHSIADYMTIPSQPSRFLLQHGQSKQRSFQHLVDYIEENRSMAGYPHAPPAEITYPLMRKFISELPSPVINWNAALLPGNNFHVLYEMTPTDILERLSVVLKDSNLFELLMKTLIGAVHTKEISPKLYESRKERTETSEDFIAHQEWAAHTKDGVPDPKMDEAGTEERLCEYIIAFSDAYFWPDIKPEHDANYVRIERVDFISFMVLQFDWIFAHGERNQEKIIHCEVPNLPKTVEPEKSPMAYFGVSLEEFCYQSPELCENYLPKFLVDTVDSLIKGHSTHILTDKFVEQEQHGSHKNSLIEAIKKDGKLPLRSQRASGVMPDDDLLGVLIEFLDSLPQPLIEPHADMQKYDLSRKTLKSANLSEADFDAIYAYTGHVVGSADSGRYQLFVKLIKLLKHMMATDQEHSEYLLDFFVQNIFWSFKSRSQHPNPAIERARMGFIFFVMHNENELFESVFNTTFHHICETFGCLDGLPLYIIQLIRKLMIPVYTSDTLLELESYHLKPMTNAIQYINHTGRLPLYVQSTNDLLNVLIIIGQQMPATEPLLRWDQKLKVRRGEKSKTVKKNKAQGNQIGSDDIFVTTENLDEKLRKLAPSDMNWNFFQKLMKLMQYMDGSINGLPKTIPGIIHDDDDEDDDDTDVAPQSTRGAKRNKTTPIVDFFVNNIFWPGTSATAGDRNAQRILINFALKNIVRFVRLPIHGYGYFTDFLCTYEPYKCKKMIPLWLTDALDDVIQADADKTKQQRINYENIRLDVTMLINGIDEWHLRQPSIQTVKRANVFRFINELPLLIFNWETVFNTLKNYREMREMTKDVMHESIQQITGRNAMLFEYIVRAMHKGLDSFGFMDDALHEHCSYIADLGLVHLGMQPRNTQLYLMQVDILYYIVLNDDWIFGAATTKKRQIPLFDQDNGVCQADALTYSNAVYTHGRFPLHVGRA